MIEAYFEEMLLDLFISAAVSSFRVLRRETSDEEGYIRIKCFLSNGDTLEFSEYVELKGNGVHIVTYTYHWQTAKGPLVTRWDNVEHHKKVKTFPHHLHLSDDTVLDSSPMNLKKVLYYIEKQIAE